MNEPAIKNAVERINAGEDLESVLNFIYHLGEVDGMLKISNHVEGQLLGLLEAA